MLICRVEGTAVATVMHPSLRGWRLLLCQPLDEADRHEGALLLALDNLGAGLHQRVLVTSDGKGIRERIGQDISPARFLTLGILDS